MSKCQHMIEKHLLITAHFV